MDIDKYAIAQCDDCDIKNSNICLHCMKQITYGAILEGTTVAFQGTIPDIEQFTDKIEALTDALNGLSTEMYKYRKDLAMKDKTDTRIWVD